MVDARLDRSQVVETYERLARRYDSWGTLAEAKARKRCLELADIRNGEAVLEVAVGTGIAFVEILKRNPDGENEGIDLTEAMLAEARKKVEKLGVGNYRLGRGDAYRLDYPDNRFDAVINSYMFDLLPERDFPAILAEFKRVLRPGGRIVVTSMTKPERWYQGIWEVLYRISPKLMGGCRGVQLLPYLTAAGFTGTRREFISQFTFPSEVLVGVKP